MMRDIVFNFLGDCPLAKKYPRMKHDDWASYIAIFTSDGKKRLAETRKRRQKGRVMRAANLKVADDNDNDASAEDDNDNDASAEDDNDDAPA